jgi:hypothetical protein
VLVRNPSDKEPQDVQLQRDRDLRKHALPARLNPNGVDDKAFRAVDTEQAFERELRHVLAVLRSRVNFGATEASPDGGAYTSLPSITPNV